MNIKYKFLRKFLLLTFGFAFVFSIFNTASAYEYGINVYEKRSAESENANTLGGIMRDFHVVYDNSVWNSQKMKFKKISITTECVGVLNPSNVDCNRKNFLLANHVLGSYENDYATFPKKVYIDQKNGRYYIRISLKGIVFKDSVNSKVVLTIKFLDENGKPADCGDGVTEKIVQIIPTIDGATDYSSLYILGSPSDPLVLANANDGYYVDKGQKINLWIKEPYHSGVNYNYKGFLMNLATKQKTYIDLKPLGIDYNWTSTAYLGYKFNATIPTNIITGKYKLFIENSTYSKVKDLILGTFLDRNIGYQNSRSADYIDKLVVKDTVKLSPDIKISVNKRGTGSGKVSVKIVSSNGYTPVLQNPIIDCGSRCEKTISRSDLFNDVLSFDTKRLIFSVVPDAGSYTTVNYNDANQELGLSAEISPGIIDKTLSTTDLTKLSSTIPYNIISNIVFDKYEIDNNTFKTSEIYDLLNQKDLLKLSTFFRMKGFYITPYYYYPGYGSLDYIRLNYYTLITDVRNAIKSYQTSKGIIPADGVFGTSTRAAVIIDSIALGVKSSVSVNSLATPSVSAATNASTSKPVSTTVSTTVSKPTSVSTSTTTSKPTSTVTTATSSKPTTTTTATTTTITTTVKPVSVTPSVQKSCYILKSSKFSRYWMLVDCKSSTYISTPSYLRMEK